MTREEWNKVKDNIRQRLEDFGGQFRRVVTDEMRATPWFFWSLMILASLPVAALWWWVLW